MAANSIFFVFARELTVILIYPFANIRLKI